MKVLVTGGCGFIGSHTVDKLVEKHDVRVYDNLEYQTHKGKIPSYLNAEAEYIFGDIRDRDLLKKAIEDVDAIFHMASAVGISQSMYQIKKYVDVNVGGAATILDILANEEHQVKKIIIPSSSTCYGECTGECTSCGIVYPELRKEEDVQKGKLQPLCPMCGKEVKSVPIKEDRPLKGRFIYALTKKQQEEIAMSFAKTYNIPVVVLRYFNVYGPRQSLFNPYTGVIAVFSSRLKNNEAPIIVEDGFQTRDFVSVHDVVLANILSLEKERADYNIFNVGSSKGITIREVASELIELHGKDIKPVITSIFRKNDVRHSIADILKISSELGWKPRVTFKQGIKEVFEWNQDQLFEDRFNETLDELNKRELTIRT